MKAVVKHLILLCVGGLIYCGIELAFRGRTHPSMFIVGGLCFLLVGAVNEIVPWETPFWQQMLLGGLQITTVEFVAGIILNIILQLNVWDYSNMPYNIGGQICLPFLVAWIGLSAVAIVLDDYLRYWLFHEEKPRYTWR